MIPAKKIPLTEDQLVSGLLNRDTAVMKKLYEMYSGALHGVILRIVQDTETAEDVLQETFVKIWNAVKSYSAEKGRLFTWMLNIARNMAIDKVRSKDFRNASQNQDITDHVSIVDGQRNTSFNPDALGVKKLVGELKPDLQATLELVYFKGYTQAEAAEELNLPLGTVKTRIRTAILELRKKFN